MTVLRDGLLLVSALAIYLTGFRLLSELVRDRATWVGPLRVPWVSISLLVVTAAVNAWQLADQSLVGSLGRNPGDLGDGHLWKVLTPLLIQSDGISQLVSNTICFILVCPVAELVLGAGSMLVLYLLGGMAGQRAGFAWFPHGGGNSVAVAGVLGGLYAMTAIDRRGHLSTRVVAILGIAAGVVLAVLPDNHGVAILTGGLIGLALSAIKWTRPAPAITCPLGSQRPT